MKVELLQDVNHPKTGQPWLHRGVVVEVSDGLAAKLLDRGHARKTYAHATAPDKGSAELTGDGREDAKTEMHIHHHHHMDEGGQQQGTDEFAQANSESKVEATNPEG